MAFIQIQVPQDAEVGDALTFTVAGETFEIPVPVDSSPGDVLQIQVDDDGKNHNDANTTANTLERDRARQTSDAPETGIKEQHQKENNDEVDSFDVPLHESLGITLEMKCSIDSVEKMSPQSTAKSTSTSAEKEERRKDDEHKGEQNYCNLAKNQLQPSSSLSDGTFAMAWPAGLHLSKCISSPSFQNYTTKKKSIVEIGSGLGVVGLAFVASASFLLSHRKGDAKKIKLVMTDLPSAIPLLQHNITWNLRKFSSNCSSSIQAHQLVWGEDLSLPSNDVDLILASDILYNVQVYESLCQSIASIIYDSSDHVSKASDSGDATIVDDDKNMITKKAGPSKCQIILAVRWRKPEEERKFFQLMESMLQYEFKLILDGIENEEYRCDLNWKEYGNPKCMKSNEYFTNTHVNVGNQNIALKDITETHMDRMTEDEYASFEARFIQIYVGSHK